MKKMCQDFILAKHRISRKHSFKVLRELYLLRRFVKGNLARKCLHKWRCAYTLAVFLRRKTLPPTSDYTLLEDCFSWWRRSYRDRIADRAYARQCVVLVLQQMRRRIVWKAQEKAAARHEELNLKRQSFAAWSSAWQLRKLCSRFELRAGRRLLQRIMTVWRIRWLRRESAKERLRTFYAVQSRGRVIRSFYHWRQRLYLKRGRRRVSKTLERSLAMAVWVRWKGRLASRQQLAGKDESRASNTRCTMLARAVWRIWRQRYAQRQELRHAAHQEELIERIKTARKQRMMAMVYFTWKRKVHMLRRRITSKRSGNVATGNALAGLNQSFQNSDTSQSASHPVNAVTNVETGQWDMCQQQRHNVFSTVHGASITRLKRWYDPNEPLGELRTERLLLHCVDSPRWKRMIHSRLFTSNKRKKPSRNAKEVEVDDPYLSAYPLPRHLKGVGGPAWLSLGDGSVDVTESLPSEIEIDPYLSLDGSELGIQEP
uniref:WGS project CAEQ00000000 data, annotated contig 1577 n=1 Tax=Trypanosoma congolense (strain IL3000) TaxID=1068625 RepID=F9W771_TRYCI|nr:unnamed protein product [Trypanosoma congolense IL3000]